MIVRYFVNGARLPWLKYWGIWTRCKASSSTRDRCRLMNINRFLFVRNNYVASRLRVFLLFSSICLFLTIHFGLCSILQRLYDRFVRRSVNRLRNKLWINFLKVSGHLETQNRHRGFTWIWILDSGSAIIFFFSPACNVPKLLCDRCQHCNADEFSNTY